MLFAHSISTSSRLKRERDAAVMKQEAALARQQAAENELSSLRSLMQTLLTQSTQVLRALQLPLGSSQPISSQSTQMPQPLLPPSILPAQPTIHKLQILPSAACSQPIVPAPQTEPDTQILPLPMATKTSFADDAFAPSAAAKTIEAIFESPLLQQTEQPFVLSQQGGVLEKPEAISSLPATDQTCNSPAKELEPCLADTQPAQGPMSNSSMPATAEQLHSSDTVCKQEVAGAFDASSPRGNAGGDVTNGPSEAELEPKISGLPSWHFDVEFAATDSNINCLPEPEQNRVIIPGSLQPDPKELQVAGGDDSLSQEVSDEEEGGRIVPISICQGHVHPFKAFNSASHAEGYRMALLPQKRNQASPETAAARGDCFEPVAAGSLQLTNDTAHVQGSPSSSRKKPEDVHFSPPPGNNISKERVAALTETKGLAPTDQHLDPILDAIVSEDTPPTHQPLAAHIFGSGMLDPPSTGTPLSAPGRILEQRSACGRTCSRQGCVLSGQEGSGVTPTPAEKHSAAASSKGAEQGSMSGGDHTLTHTAHRADMILPAERGSSIGGQRPAAVGMTQQHAAAPPLSKARHDPWALYVTATAGLAQSAAPPPSERHVSAPMPSVWRTGGLRALIQGALDPASKIARPGDSLSPIEPDRAANEPAHQKSKSILPAGSPPRQVIAVLQAVGESSPSQGAGEKAAADAKDASAGVRHAS